MPKRLSVEGQDILTKVMEIDPEKRLTTADIKAHKWYVSAHNPVHHCEGLIIGQNEIPIEPSMLGYLEQFGFKSDFATTCLNKNKHNQVTTVYYLMHKKFEKEGKFKTAFEVKSTP